uniref:Chitin-binding type-2 domain-containing protein n=1 Tax=Graphocephala atropunctata TaxID=36148 RepID=A0A1B6LWX8_9HEMI
MYCRTIFRLLTLAVLFAAATPEPAPQFYPLPFPGQPGYSPPQDSVYNGAQQWQQTLQNNFSNPNFLDPLSSPAAEQLLKNDVPRQLYGVPPPPNPQLPQYPQIYKLDNLIIIANPPQPQPCIQRPPPDFPIPKPGGGSEDGLDNRIGDEPTKCTWAIVACCSPGSNAIRYNCFELLGCPGFFFDNSPCDPKIVMAAANAALEYYRTANNGSTDNNQL